VVLLAAAERRIGIADPGDPHLVTHSVADILRTRILAIACGYEDADDLDHLRSDPGALTALQEHAELLRMFVDPRRRIEESQDRVDESGESFKKLGYSKQEALREILSTIPLFLHQGPPGVGKTYLVGDVVRRRFDDEPTTRVLLTAQSNSAIDHLMNEVQPIFEDVAIDKRLLMVRARSADDDESASELEIDIQANRLLQILARSEMVAEASSHLAAKNGALASARSGSGRSRSGTSGGDEPLHHGCRGHRGCGRSARISTLSNTRKRCFQYGAALLWPAIVAPVEHRAINAFVSMQKCMNGSGRKQCRHLAYRPLTLNGHRYTAVR
jgi:hypothetical protein